MPAETPQSELSPERAEELVTLLRRAPVEYEPDAPKIRSGDTITASLLPVMQKALQLVLGEEYNPENTYEETRTAQLIEQQQGHTQTSYPGQIRSKQIIDNSSFRQGDTPETQEALKKVATEQVAVEYAQARLRGAILALHRLEPN